MLFAGNEADNRVIRKKTQTWCFDAFIVIWVDADIVAFPAECVFAVLNCNQLVMIRQIRPAPKTTVDHVRHTFLGVNLQAAIKRPGHTHTPEINQIKPMTLGRRDQ